MRLSDLTKTFRLFYVSFVISILGDAFRLLAVNVWIFQSTEGSPTERLLLVLLGNLPGLLLGGISGVLADRWDKYSVLVGSDVLRLCVGLGLAWCAANSHPHAALGLVAFGNGLGVFFASSSFALLPRLVNKRHLMGANGLMETAQSVVQVVGPSLAALTLVFAGAASAFLIDSASFLASGLILFILRRQLKGTEPNRVTEGRGDKSENDLAEEGVGPVAEGYWRSFISGVQLITTNKQIRALLGASYGITFLVACTNFTLIFLIADSLGKNAAALGAIYSLNGVVAVAAAAGTTIFLAKRNLGRVMTFAMVGLCAAQVIMGLSPNLWVLGVGVAVSALSNAPYNVAITTLYMQFVPEKYLGRVEGVDTTVDSAVSIMAFVISLGIVSFADPRFVFLASAVIAVPSLLLAAVRVSPYVGQQDHAEKLGV